MRTEEEEEEEEEEPEKKSRSKGRGNARNATSKTGRPRRSTAGRGKGDWKQFRSFFTPQSKQNSDILLHLIELGHLDTSAYVEYSSSSDDDEKPQNRSKPAKRRRDDSDSGSDVRTDRYVLLRAQRIDFIYFTLAHFHFDIFTNAWYSTIHRDRIRMLETNGNQIFRIVDDLVAVAVHVVANHLLKKRNHRQHPMKISVMNRKAESKQHRHVVEAHETAVANQKNRKSPNYPKRMMKSCQNQKVNKARFVTMMPRKWIEMEHVKMHLFNLNML